jgi:poly(3-hydroxyalkanoate) synthetase
MRQRHRTDETLSSAGASILDLLDHLITQGVLVDGELVLGLANVDLVNVRLSVVLCAADRIPLAPEGACP